MVIDTSAIVAVSQKEDGYQDILTAMYNDTCLLSAANLQELYMVIYGRFSDSGWQETETLLTEYSVNVLPLDESITRVAMNAFVTYGKGQGSKAQLNYGDCLAYATAKALNEPLLFVGDDFKHTDIQSVL